MPKVISQREKLILLVTIFVIALSLLYNFFLAPQISELTDVNRDIAFTRAKIKKYLKLLSQKESIQSRYNDLIAQLDSSGAQKQDVLVNALTGLEVLAKNANIRIIDIRPQSTSARGNKEVIIELKIEGAIDGYLKFLYDIENSLLLLRIKKCQISVKRSFDNLEGLFTMSAPSLQE